MVLGLIRDAASRAWRIHHVAYVLNLYPAGTQTSPRLSSVPCCPPDKVQERQPPVHVHFFTILITSRRLPPHLRSRLLVCFRCVPQSVQLFREAGASAGKGRFPCPGPPYLASRSFASRSRSPLLLQSADLVHHVRELPDLSSASAARVSTTFCLK